MAALCRVMVAKSIAKSALIPIAANNQCLKHIGGQLQKKLLVSQLKRFCSQKPSTRRTSRCGHGWMLAGAGVGLTQAFLGFSFGKKDEKKENDLLLRVFREAKEAHLTRDFGKAENRYHDALKVADELLKQKKIDMKTYIYARTNIFDSLADMALGLGQLEKAEGLYKETMKGCLQQGLPQDDNSIIELSIKLSSIYAMMDRQKEAEEGLLYCINAQDAKLTRKSEVADALPLPDSLKDVVTDTEATQAAFTNTSNNADVSNNAAIAKLDPAEMSKDTEALLGMALETYGRFLLGHRRLSESVPIFERALTSAAKVLGTEHEQYLVLMNDLATAHILLRQYDQATQILDSAIASGQKVKSGHLPVLYCNLGAVFLRRSRLAEAEAACQKGKELSSESKHKAGLSMAQKCLEKIHEVRKKASA